MLCELDGPVSSFLRSEGQHATSVAAHMTRGSRESVPFLGCELAKFLLQKGYNWQQEPAGRSATPTHVYVCDGGDSRIVRIGDLEDHHDDHPIVRPFDAQMFSDQIDRMIDHGDAYRRAMGETFFLGMRESARA